MIGVLDNFSTYKKEERSFKITRHKTIRSEPFACESNLVAFFLPLKSVNGQLKIF